MQMPDLVMTNPWNGSARRSSSNRPYPRRDTRQKYIVAIVNSL
jgi:hypothetical protein